MTVKGWISGVAVFATGSDPILKVGAIQSEVTVASTATLVNTTNQTLSGLVDDRRVQDLPLNGRNILGLAGMPKGIYGNSGRNIINGPSFNNTDFTLMKDMRLREPLKIQLRGEFFNAFNQVHFDPPNVSVTSGSFGRILSAQPGRVVQAALKFIW